MTAPSYRWVVLAAVMAVNMPIQMLWISYSTVADHAARYYAVSTDAIGYFSIVFMIAFLPFSIPSSALIDRKGLRLAVGIGAIATAVGGLVRGAAGPHFGLAMAATSLVAAAQPLLLNCWTTTAGRWFPHRHRAMAVSLITLANLLGTALGGVLTPLLIDHYSLAQVQFGYGVCAAVSAVFFVVAARDAPSATMEGTTVKALATEGLRHAVRQRPFLALLGCAFVGLGVFNSVATWVELIIAPRGFGKEDAGLMLALMLIGGVLGALILGAIAGRTGRRVPWMALGLGLGVPALLAFGVVTNLVLLAVAAIWLGFFLTGAIPVCMQYAAEITAPTPEGTSNGLVQLVGQSGFVLVVAMSVTRRDNGSFIVGILALAVLLALSAWVASRLPEPSATARIPGDLD